MCAAVSDYKPATVEPRKMKKRKTPFALELIPTRDILASLPKENRNYLVVGFAAETHDLETNARKKLREKNCDMIVANDVSKTDSGMESDENAVTIFFRNGESQNNFAPLKKNNRARARENNFKDVRKMFDKKIVMITDTGK